MTWLNTLSAGLMTMILAITTITFSVSAETSKKDIQISARAVAFMNTPPSGDVTAAIVYDPANAASKSEADAIAAIMASGIKAGKAKLLPKLVGTDALSELAGSKVAFITGGIAGLHANISAESASRGILTISTDMDCVNSGNCVVGIASKPKVEIVISSAARDAAGLGFKSAFLMMVKER